MPYPPPGDKIPRFSTVSPDLPPLDQNPPIFKNSTNKKIKAKHYLIIDLNNFYNYTSLK
jgi:hypothetical protein